MTISRVLIALFLVALVGSMIFMGQIQAASARPGGKDAKAGKVRVITESEDKASAAMGRGCDAVRETKGLKALLCEPEIAYELGLKEDIKLFKSDTKAIAQIDASSVQKSGNKGAGRVIVILDTGYNYNHPELSSSYLGGKDFVNNDNDPIDDNGHGSHVAGLITADGVKYIAKGIAPKAGIIAGKVLDDEGSGYFSDVVAAIYWAVEGPDGVAGTTDDFKADAINLSMGTGAPYLYSSYCNSEIPSMTNAIKYALAKGVIVVAAAGNYGKDGVSIPGCISYSLTIGAVSAQDTVASFSGRGKGVDLSAPGTNLLSSWLGSSYYRLSGTSMATPIVSATIALMKYEHPSYSATKVQQVLFDTSLDLGKEGRDWSYGYGRVVVSSAVA